MKTETGHVQIKGIMIMNFSVKIERNAPITIKKNAHTIQIGKK